MNYKVIYEIEVEAESLNKAALEVEKILKDGNYHPCLKITDENGNYTKIDLELNIIEDGEDENKHIKILAHNISYYFRDTDLDMGEGEEGHIEYMISRGYIEGGLTMTDPNNPEEVYYGYWRIEK